MEHREFLSIGESVIELNEREHAAFLFNIQKSILNSLQKRNLLTASQREVCLREIEKKHGLLAAPHIYHSNDSNDHC